MRAKTGDGPSSEIGQSLALSRGLLRLRVFTLSELSAHAGVDQKEALRFLRERGDWVQRIDDDRWKVVREAISAIQASIPEESPNATSGDTMIRAASAAPSSGRESASEAQRQDDSDFDPYVLAARLVNEAESQLQEDAIQSGPAVVDDADGILSDRGQGRIRNLAAAGTYLKSCEATYWSQVRWQVRVQDEQLASIRSLRQRIDNMSNPSPMPEDDAGGMLREVLQDWSRPLSVALSSTEARAPAVLQTLSDEEVSHWVTSDLGLSSPWYQASARAAILRQGEAARWQRIRGGVISNCLDVLRLACSAPALASISALAVTLEASEMALPVLGAFLLAQSQGASVNTAELSSRDRRIVLTALCRLAQAPAHQARVHSPAAYACELLLANGADPADYELLAPGAILGDLTAGLPWLGRVMNLPCEASRVFDRNIAKALFLAAREPKLRSSLAVDLTSEDGLALVRRLHHSGGIRYFDSADGHQMIPSPEVAQSLQEVLRSSDNEMDVIALNDLSEVHLEESIYMSVILSNEINQRAKSGEGLGSFSKGLRARSAPAALVI